MHSFNAYSINIRCIKVHKCNSVCAAVTNWTDASKSASKQLIGMPHYMIVVIIKSLYVKAIIAQIKPSLISALQTYGMLTLHNSQTCDTGESLGLYRVIYMSLGLGL